MLGRFLSLTQKFAWLIILMAIFMSETVLSNVSANAGSAPIFPSGHPTGMAIRHNTQLDSNGNLQLYGGSGGPPDNWVFGQFLNPPDREANAPPEFPPLSQDSNGNWSAGNGMALIMWQPNGAQPSWQLAQNGQYYPFTNSKGQILENDMSISANTAADPVSPTRYPAAEIQYNNLPYLSQLESYSMSGIYQLNSMRYAFQNNGCQMNSSNSSIGLLVINTASSTHQILFYSLLFSQFCYDDGAPGSLYASCQQNVTNPTPAWYWLGAQGTGSQYQVSSDGTQDYGIVDTLQAYGYSQISDTSPHSVSLDIRTRIITIISGGYKGMDSDISHWKIVNPALQQVTWGNTFMYVSWAGFIPVMTTK